MYINEFVHRLIICPVVHARRNLHDNGLVIKAKRRGKGTV